MDFPSFQDYFRIARDEALARNAQLTKDAIERQGSDANIIIAAACAAADEATTQLAKATASLFIDSAKGTDLDKLVFDRWALTRKAAAPAVGQVQLTTSTATVSAFTIPAGTQFSTPSGNVFVSTDPSVTFPSGSTGPVNVNVQSLLAGSNQQAAVGQITSILSQITGAPSGLSASNSTATAGAADEETDDSLRNRARTFFTTVRRGTLSALIQGALSVPGVVTANAFETSGNVQLIITDAFTLALATLSTVPASYQTQAQTFATTVFNALNDYRAFGIPVQIIVAQVVLQSVQLALTFPAGADTVTIAAAAVTAAIGYVNSLSPGQALSRSALLTIISGVSGLQFTGNEVVVPTGDVVPTALQVIRTTSALVTTYTPATH